VSGGTRTTNMGKSEFTSWPPHLAGLVICRILAGVCLGGDGTAVAAAPEDIRGDSSLRSSA
jgi:hypothetical protein